MLSKCRLCHGRETVAVFKLKTTTHALRDRFTVPCPLCPTHAAPKLGTCACELGRDAIVLSPLGRVELRCAICTHRLAGPYTTGRGPNQKYSHVKMSIDTARARRRLARSQAAT
jgi:hypothetical protein